MKRALLTPLAALALLAPIGAGCTEETVPAPDSTAPSGALYGRVLEADGSPVTDGTVELYQFTRDDQIATGAAILTLGVFCLAPGFCPTPVNGELSSEGAYSFPARVMKKDPDITLTAEIPGEDDLLGPSTSAVIRDRKDPQAAPPLVLWRSTPEVSGSLSARVAWPGIGHLPHGPQIRYSVFVQPARGVDWGARLAAGATDANRTTVDLRPYEDEEVQLSVAALTKTSIDDHQVAYAYSSPGVLLPMAGAPPSRDAHCLADDDNGGLRPTDGPCPLTDGDFGLSEDVRLKGECLPSSGASTPTNCEMPKHRRVCVDLGPTRPISLIVLRPFTPLSIRDARVELSSDGRHFQTVGRGSEDEIITIRVRGRQTARMACVHDSSGRIGLDELSVW